MPTKNNVSKPANGSLKNLVGLPINLPDKYMKSVVKYKPIIALKGLLKTHSRYFLTILIIFINISTALAVAGLPDRATPPLDRVKESHYKIKAAPYVKHNDEIFDTSRPFLLFIHSFSRPKAPEKVYDI